MSFAPNCATRVFCYRSWADHGGDRRPCSLGYATATEGPAAIGLLGSLAAGADARVAELDQLQESLMGAMRTSAMHRGLILLQVLPSQAVDGFTACPRAPGGRMPRLELDRAFTAGMPAAVSFYIRVGACS